MSPIRLVLADDHATLREALKLLCDAQADMQVVGEASNGEEAVEVAARLKPDVVLMDVTMPRMNGLRATMALKQRAPSVRVLTLTRHTGETYLRELLRAGVAGFAAKQSTTADLLSAIRTVAAGRQYLDPAVSNNLVGAFLRGRAPGSPDLTTRENEVLQLISWGYSNKEIAARLELSVKTIEVHKANGMRNLGIRSRTELVKFALLRGWLQET
jgi:DNA-binding NarL/FixJ family response regulator